MKSKARKKASKSRTEARFTRRIETFTCAHCGVHVQGSGYTNHCPLCLWSKHVDINPGDRAERCGGMMEPIGVEGGAKYILIHRCVTCGLQRRIGVSPKDSVEALIKLAQSVQNGITSRKRSRTAG